MKNWTGGTLISILAIVLVLRYSFIEKEPRQQQLKYAFFHNHPTNESSKDIKSPQPRKELILVKKRSHVVIEGLRDLYPVKNALEEVSKLTLVWAHMHSILHSSDTLPEAAHGIKEASIAWKELLASIEMENKSKFTSTSHDGKFEEPENCPFSVNMQNQTISRNGTVIDFSCGLIEGSSVTVVGVPRGCNESFQIELTGSQFPGELKPAVILQYNVSLPGDKSRKEPVIVQNTWTAEQEWGKEERCPAFGSASNGKVDGLVQCNQQAVSTFPQEKLNKSLPNDTVFKGQKGSSHASFNFPFSEGNPFTATLWVGREGFHMTVNGRHETSFAYREKLEPWLVTKAKVTGGLDIFSALANGLPVSENDLHVDAERLKAPPISRKRLTMLIGVFSTGNNFERRMALRRSWMQYDAVRTGDVAVRFIVGLVSDVLAFYKNLFNAISMFIKIYSYQHKNRQVNMELWKEAQAYGDIQLMPFVDYYSLITLKTVSICIMGTKILPAKYLMKTDDDAFVRVDEVLFTLKGKNSSGLLYGLISFESSPHRDKDSKWYISAEEWQHSSYPPWAHGPGYIISHDIAKFVVQGHKDKNLKSGASEEISEVLCIANASYERLHAYIPYKNTRHARM
ncbi:hypothetical protein Sjap_007201 [Stephania japonica]|uniref:Galectin domain-containing protein n=1 Tax=Stephania japonica TaxID=461633 RepID=A0AAP0JPI0_9MAGN